MLEFFLTGNFVYYWIKRRYAEYLKVGITLVSKAIKNISRWFVNLYFSVCLTMDDGIKKIFTD